MAGHFMGPPRPSSSWPEPSTHPRLAAGEIHVWRAWLDMDVDRQQELAMLLDAAERERAARFRFALDRERFIARRGLLRCILARYLALTAADVPLAADPHGKPGLSPALGSTVQFNLAHSENLALVALADGQPVGVDVERVTPHCCDEEVVARLFAAGERAEFEILPPAARAAAFFRTWVRKEAFLKGTGVGLSLALSAFRVPMTGAARRRWELVTEAPEALGQWVVHDLDPAPGFVAAVGVPAPGCPAKCYAWVQKSGK